MKTYPTAKATCLNCGHPFDCASTMERDGGPVAGDITMCLWCGELFQFTKELGIEPVQLANLLDLTPSQHHMISRAQKKARLRRAFRK